MRDEGGTDAAGRRRRGDRRSPVRSVEREVSHQKGAGINGVE